MPRARSATGEKDRNAMSNDTFHRILCHFHRVFNSQINERDRASLGFRLLTIALNYAQLAQWRWPGRIVLRKCVQNSSLCYVCSVRNNIWKLRSQLNKGAGIGVNIWYRRPTCRDPSALVACYLWRVWSVTFLSSPTKIIYRVLKAKQAG